MSSTTEIACLAIAELNSNRPEGLFSHRLDLFRMTAESKPALAAVVVEVCPRDARSMTRSGCSAVLMRVGLKIQALGKIRSMSERNVLIRVQVLSRLLSEALTELDANALSSEQLLGQLREVGDRAAEQLDQLAPCGRE